MTLGGLPQGKGKEGRKVTLPATGAQSHRTPGRWYRPCLNGCPSQRVRGPGICPSLPLSFPYVTCSGRRHCHVEDTQGVYGEMLMAKGPRPPANSHVRAPSWKWAFRPRPKPSDHTAPSGILIPTSRAMLGQTHPDQPHPNSQCTESVTQYLWG